MTPAAASKSESFTDLRGRAVEPLVPLAVSANCSACTSPTVGMAILHLRDERPLLSWPALPYTEESPAVDGVGIYQRTTPRAVRCALR